ncbi:dehydrodolichyl diphosphate synthase complex subunit Dhdds-like [Diabrotica virgifera virgifera]|uniref:Alkyl transferase n=1 Tax=Diabrotica virgifera virgifera TaxID=50390 RepID=A0ABM5K0I0_DIAVI|nr:dehydrodolichyl diphosphate synthase complex subunit Dhdds-like [Diabrotica virgifera virgifera]
MPWIQSKLSIFHKFCLRVLKQGPIPEHMAIIMDGNRRFAKNKNIETIQAHSLGFSKLIECIEWFRELGIRELTVYAFSTENLKRTKKEVEDLMQLAEETFSDVVKEESGFRREGIRLRIIGDVTNMPEHVKAPSHHQIIDSYLIKGALRKAMDRACEVTKDNNEFIFNVAFFYVARDEIAASVKSVVEGVQEGCFKCEDISENLISKSLYSQFDKNPDMMIRTSGEVRLSDFLLWQISESYLYFTDVLWPDFSLWHLFTIIFSYQRSCGFMNLQK